MRNQKAVAIIGLVTFIGLLSSCGSDIAKRTSLIQEGCTAALIGDEVNTRKNFQELISFDPGYVNAANGAISWSENQVGPWEYSLVADGANALAYIEYQAFQAICATQLSD